MAMVLWRVAPDCTRSRAVTAAAMWRRQIKQLRPSALLVVRLIFSGYSPANRLLTSGFPVNVRSGK